MTKQPNLSRRDLLAGASALGAASMFAGAPALAKAPIVGTQAPYWYRFKLGNFEGTVVSDGILPLGKPEDNFLGLTKDEMAKQLRDNFLPMDNAVLEQNAVIINTGNQLVLFDTGLGSLNIFGPTTGKLLANMRQAGIDPKDIDAVVMSHGHIDHLGGNVADSGSVNFPNAQFYITQADQTSGPITARCRPSSKSSPTPRTRTSSPCATASSSSRTGKRSCRGCTRSSRPVTPSATPSS
ncbi:MAG: beta-lactamase [Microvirga sp.]|jgi:hypothetical protein|nr:beta-lactamase [Microvirga sp.]